MCNGDQDCEEDREDENSCPQDIHNVCPDHAPPPNVESTGFGVDITSGQTRSIVINTKSFGGQCRTVFSGIHNTEYRLPISTDQYSFMAKVKNDFSDEMYNSVWKYAKDVVNKETVTGTTKGFHNYEYHMRHDKTKTKRLLVLDNYVEVGQFQSTAPQYIPISEVFWRALAKLPAVYDYAAYRALLERFGTHYISEGNLGGSLSIISVIDEEMEKMTTSESDVYHECEKKKRWILFFPLTIEKCKRDTHYSTSKPIDINRNNNWNKVTPIGGDPSFVAQLENMQPGNLEKNWELYSNWAESVRYFPRVTKQKLRPLSELVKEVQCAAVKKHYLRKAIDDYISEHDSCHCRPCRNNGLPVIEKKICKCLCKEGTSGPACEVGAEVDGQPGVIHGSWSCWSPWSGCTRGRMSRSRSCSNPSPQNGGQSCIGEPSMTSDCDDQELNYLKTMEPQCFDHSLPASQKCAQPPALINGYVLNPQDIYIVGSKAEYTCIAGYHLRGQKIIECSADQTWSAHPGQCTLSRCKFSSRPADVILTPLQQSYSIGQTVSLSCPEGQQIEGATTVICDASLNFSPDPANIKCSAVSVPGKDDSPAVQCKPWEKVFRGQCVCKMPYECSSSMELCTTSPASGRSVLLNVCKLHALRCLKKDHVIAEDSACTWPQPKPPTDCTSCQMWETCDDQTNQCRCKDAADCSTPGINVCVRVGEDSAAANQTMSECEAGLQRCKGGKVSVVDITPCTS